MLARDLARVSGISLASALKLVDDSVKQSTRKAVHDIVRPLL